MSAQDPNRDDRETDLRPPAFTMRQRLQLPPATDNDRDPNHAPIEGYIMFENRSGDLVFVWRQTTTNVATVNGGYSIPAEILESVPLRRKNHIEQFWIIDEEVKKVRRFPRSFFEDNDLRSIVDPTQTGPDVPSYEQYAVDLSMMAEEHDLETTEIPDTSSGDVPDHVIGER